MRETNYQLNYRVARLRSYIKEREAVLAIRPDHDESGHFYISHERRYPSVTAKLQILKDPALANWKMNRALWYVEQEIAKIKMNHPESTFGGFDLTNLIECAKELPQTEFTNAGSIGTQVHEWREAYFKNIIDRGYELENVPAVNPMADPAVVSGSRAIQKFMAETKYIPIACELPLVDHELKLGGMVDDIGILPGKRNRLVVVDLKTSTIGNKTSYFYQVALYFHMFWKLYKIKPQGAYILHVSKFDGTYKLIEIPDIPQLIKEAKLILKVNDAIDRVEASRVKQPIVI